MPINQPGRADVHVDKPLTNIAVAFTQNPEMFISDRVFQILPVVKQSDKYFTIPRGNWYRDEMKKRAPGALSQERTHTVSTDSYVADVWALHENLADETLQNYDSPLQAEREMTEGLTLAGMIRKEVAWAADFFTTSVWTSDLTGVNSGPTGDQFLQWDDDASTPIEDLRWGMRRVHERTGYRPNVLTLGREVFDQLLDHPDIVGRLDRGQTRGPAIVQRDSLAALLELDEVLVMDSVRNTATEGATDSFSFIGGKSALLSYRPPSPGLYVPAAGYTFSWTGFVGAGGLQIRRVRDDKRQSLMIELQMAWDQKQVSADLGQFFATAVA